MLFRDVARRERFAAGSVSGSTLRLDRVDLFATVVLDVGGSSSAGLDVKSSEGRVCCGRGSTVAGVGCISEGVDWTEGDVS